MDGPQETFGVAEQNAVSRAQSGRGLAELEADWRRRFVLQPKLPSSALLAGAVAMALGFGAVMFLAFAAATGFHQGYLVPGVLFASGSLALGLLNRRIARRWFGEVKVWSAEREALQREIESARQGAADRR